MLEELRGRYTLGAVRQPATRYAQGGDGRIAYQAFGEASRDLVVVPPFVSHVELAWEHPPYERFMERLASFTRVVVFDKLGTGLSDPLDRQATFEQRMDDIRAVMDAAGSEPVSYTHLTLPTTPYV